MKFARNFRALAAMLALALFLSTAAVLVGGEPASAAIAGSSRLSATPYVGTLGDQITVKPVVPCQAGFTRVVLRGAIWQGDDFARQLSTVTVPVKPNGSWDPISADFFPAGTLLPSNQHLAIDALCQQKDPRSNFYLSYGYSITARFLSDGTDFVSQDLPYISQVYSDLLGRDVDPTGLAGWANQLDSGVPRGAVANGITASDEFRSGLISAAYDSYLGRQPDATGMRGWLTLMGRGLTLEQLDSGFVGSDEYFLKAGGTREGWVTLMYHDILGRDPDAAGYQHWLQVLAENTSRGDVALGFLISYEYLSGVVDDYYQGLLGRPSDPQGQHDWTIALQSGSRDEQIIAGIIASDEYYNQLSA